jgi:hypothetical protein
MDKKLNVDELYTAFSSLHDSAKPVVTAEQIFNSVYTQFGSFDAMTQQNFLTFLGEEYRTFSSIEGIFEKILELCNKLLSTDNLGNQTTALATLTKLYLQTNLDAQKEEKFKEFIKYLFTKSNDLNEVPHLRNICSQCIQEISMIKGSKFINIPSEKLLEAAAANHAPTAYSELAYSNGCNESDLKKFLNKRFWSMSPLESSLFAPKFFPQYPAIPNDPLLLRNSLAKGEVPLETALSLINNPFSSFGVAQTIYGFNDSLEFDGKSLFTPFDKEETIAAKCNLLPRKISSIDENPVLASFTEKQSNSAVVSAVFGLAARFAPSDIFAFYRRFYESTPLLDEQWIKLYNKIDQQIKETIKCFIVNYPTRKSAQVALLQSENGNVPISIINSCDKETAELLINAIPNLSPEAKLCAREKLKELGIKRDTIVAQASYASNTPLLEVISTQISTSDLTNTQITINFKPINELVSPIFGVCFRLEKGSIFAENGIITLPMINGECSVTFQMKPTRIESDALTLICEYTADDGSARFFPLDKVTVESHDLLSPSDVEFKQAWKEGEESRIILPIKFQEIVSAMNKTVIGKNPHCEHEESRIQSVVATPMGSTVAIVAVASGQQTIIHFKASSLDILAEIDIFIRSIST